MSNDSYCLIFIDFSGDYTQNSSAFARFQRAKIQRK